MKKEVSNVTELSTVEQSIVKLSDNHQALEKRILELESQVSVCLRFIRKQVQNELDKRGLSVNSFDKIRAIKDSN